MDSLKDLKEILELIPEGERLKALAELKGAFSKQDVKVDCQSNGNVYLFNGDGQRNSLSLGGKGGWNSKKSSSTETTEFKVQSKGPYLGDAWVEVYETVRSHGLLWEASKSDGTLLPPHKGEKWDKKGERLGLVLGDRDSCPDGYVEASRVMLRSASGPERTRLCFRPKVFEHASKKGLIVLLTEGEEPKKNPDPEEASVDTGVDETSVPTLGVGFSLDS